MTLISVPCQCSAASSWDFVCTYICIKISSLLPDHHCQCEYRGIISRSEGLSYLHNSLYLRHASFTNSTSSKRFQPSRPLYRSVSRCATASFHLRISSSASSARNPIHHPSRRTTSTSPGSTFFHSRSGTRSPFPSWADLS